MTPPVWTDRDEALWHAYACAALPGFASFSTRPDAERCAAAAALADAMLAEHRKRFPPPEARVMEGGPFR